jgi:ABC-type polysaccharide/polyol phosphate export permease
MRTLIRDLVKRRELLLMLIGRNLKIRYKKSSLGFLWSLLSPLILIGIYATFLSLIRIQIHLPTLVTGIIVWQFLALCTGDSLHAVVGNANLVTKAAFPRLVLPLSMVGANLVNFLLSFAVLILYVGLMALRGDAAFGALYLLPVAVVAQTALCLGLACALSAANVFFRDTEHILSVSMLAWFFLSPVIYEPKMVLESTAFPAWLHVAFFANPMTGIVTLYRMALLSAPGPGAGLLALSCAVAAGIGVAGVAVFQAVQPRFGDEL